jgi:heme/copper-type cytochrome/quinol oxidase subunit 2
MAPKSQSSALQAQPSDTTGSAADENGADGEGGAGVSFLWILAIFVNILFVLFVFALLGYCLNKYKKRTNRVPFMFFYDFLVLTSAFGRLGVNF